MKFGNIRFYFKNITLLNVVYFFKNAELIYLDKSTLACEIYFNIEGEHKKIESCKHIY